MRFDPRPTTPRLTHRRVFRFALLLSTFMSAHAVAQTSTDNHVHTYGGVDLGEPNAREITESESAVRFTDPGDVKTRRSARLSDRTWERLILRNNAVMTYTKLFLRGQSFGPRVPGKAFAELPYLIKGDFLVSRGIKYDEHDAKQAGLLAYLIQSSATATCFVFNAYLGDSVSFDQQVTGNVCFSKSSRSAAQLEHEMLALLSRARFAPSMDSANFAMSFEIPETAPAELAPSQRQAAPSTPTVPATPAKAPPSSSAAAQRLQDLKDLLDRKQISPSEYDAKRKAIIDEL